MKEYKLGKVVSLNLSVESQAIVGAIVLWAVLSSVGVALLNLSLGPAVVGGLIAVILHWLSALGHQLGHAWVAHRTGYPMTGIRLGKWLVLGTSLYPPDEGSLPGGVHIRRALGGPIGSLMLSVIAGIIAVALYPMSGAARWVSLFFLVDNFVLLTLGAFCRWGSRMGAPC